MVNWFYTDSKATQQGPLDGAALLDLNRDGTITASSLVWKEGMEEWQPFGSVASELFESGEDGEPVEVGVCAYSGRVYRIEDLIPYGEALVGLEFKDEFVQQMMEHGTVDIADATDNPLSYVGFWWRALSSFLDYLVKIAPSYLFMIPYYVVEFSSTAAGQSSGDDFDLGMSLGSAIAMGIGGIANMAFSVFYETWMVGKYQGTLGKLIIGAKVVNPDGSRVSYKKAFLRWLAKKPLNYTIVWTPSTIGFVLVIVSVTAASEGSDAAASVLMSMMTGMVIYVGLLVLCSGVYWMAAFDKEKRALHDRVAGTRVVKK